MLPLRLLLCIVFEIRNLYVCSVGFWKVILMKALAETFKRMCFSEFLYLFLLHIEIELMSTYIYIYIYIPGESKKTWGVWRTITSLVSTRSS